MKAHIESRGGEVRVNAPVARIETNEDGTVSGLAMRDGTTVTADMYVSAMPVDIMKRMTPEPWQKSARAWGGGRGERIGASGAGERGRASGGGRAGRASGVVWRVTTCACGHL